ncbi:hypothetical protein IV203_004585 [Nitzschia inconspicua]|uniref:Uncharacterized protein n=1 Tax=Nitzschia inconspicua TaxID=303405 RepID=A0A9K3PS06_9STRA|nr:hypothetical protein IV203_004585 [Nitzschia inconspicua]
MSLLNQIENNEVADLRISAAPKEALEGKKKEDALLEALAKNSSITSVQLEEDFLACLRADIRSAPEYFDALETVLQNHATLKEFELINCMASNQSVDLDKLKIAADQ